MKRPVSREIRPLNDSARKEPQRAERKSVTAKSLRSSMVSAKKVGGEEASYRIKYDKLKTEHVTLQSKFDQLVQKHEKVLSVLQKMEKKQKELEKKLSKMSEVPPKVFAASKNTLKEGSVSFKKGVTKTSEKFLGK